MNSHLNYPIINHVDSVLISYNQPIKLIPQSKCMIESKYTADTGSFLFSQPSFNCQSELQIISPFSSRSAGSDSNANLKAFAAILLESTFSSKNYFYQNLLMQKFNVDIRHLIKILKIKNYNHQLLSVETMLNTVGCFLQKVSKKKLKNSLADLQQQLSALPMVLDHLILIFRGILGANSIENADDYNQTINSNQTISVLCQFFNLNYTQKINFYLFKQHSLYIFKHINEYIFGKYQFSNAGLLQASHHQRAQTNQNLKKIIQIRQVSAQSMSLSTFNQHEQPTKNKGSTHFLNPKEMKTKKIQQIKQQTKKYPEDFSIISKKNQNGNYLSNFPCIDLKTQSPKNFLLKQVIEKIQQTTGLNSAKNTLKSKSIDSISQQTIKKIFSQKCFNPNTSLQTFKQDKFEDNAIQQMISNSEIKTQKQVNSFDIDKHSSQENQFQLMKKVQTVCYQTCLTCNRRFFKNQFCFNVFKIDINSNTKPGHLQAQINLKKTNKMPIYLQNKHFNKKLTQQKLFLKVNGNVQKKQNNQQKNIEKQEKISTKQNNQIKTHLSWLSKKKKTQNIFHAKNNATFQDKNHNLQKISQIQTKEKFQVKSFLTFKNGKQADKTNKIISISNFDSVKQIIKNDKAIISEKLLEKTSSNGNLLSAQAIPQNKPEATKWEKSIIQKRFSVAEQRIRRKQNDNKPKQELKALIFTPNSRASDFNKNEQLNMELNQIFND